MLSSLRGNNIHLPLFYQLSNLHYNFRMILITGATGFAGRSLTAQFIEAGIEFKTYNGRINDPFKLREQLKDITVVIHLAGAEARGRDRLLRHIDLQGTMRLLEECQRVEVRHFIYISRMNANPDVIHPLLKIKGEVERLIQKSGIPYTILRSASLYGRTDRFFEILVSLAIWSWPFVFLPGWGHMSFQPLWVEDFIHCIMLTIKRPELIGKTITLAGEERIPYNELMRQLLLVSGHRRLAIPLPMTLTRLFSRFLFSWWYWPAVSRYFVDRFFVPELTDYDTVMRHFGFRPRPLKENLSYLKRSGLRWRLFRR